MSSAGGGDEDMENLPRLLSRSDVPLPLRAALEAARVQKAPEARLAAIAFKLPLAAGGATTAAATGVAAVLKSKVLVGLIGAAVVAGGAAGYRFMGPPPVPRATVAQPPSAPRVVPQIEPIVSPVVAPPATPVIEPPRHQRVRPIKPTRPSPAPEVAPAQPPAQDIAAEAQMLNAARASLAAAPAEARRLADAHAQRFPAGLLVQEREVIAIDALMGMGDQAGARARASAFKQRFPESVHWRRIVTLIGPAEGGR